MKIIVSGVCLLCIIGLAWAGPTTDLATRYLGEWEGPANVYDDLNVLQPTNARLAIQRSAENEKLLIVELRLFENRLTRFTRCEIAPTGELRIREDLMVDLRHIKVDGVLKSMNGKRIEEALIRFFVETPQGDWRPYYAVKFAAERLKAKPVPPANESSPAPEKNPTTEKK